MTEPKRIGKYEILEEIGRGGFAAVFKVRDTELDRIVALKVLHPQLTTDPKFVQRFLQESEIAAGLHHPHIINVYGAGEEAGQYYLAMDYLRGAHWINWWPRDHFHWTESSQSLSRSPVLWMLSINAS